MMVLKLITLEDHTEYTSVVQIRNSKTEKLLLNCEKLSNTPTRINYNIDYHYWGLCQMLSMLNLTLKPPGKKI